MEMKKIVLLLASAALAVAAALSCNKVENPVEESWEGEYTEVTFNVNVDGVDVQTRAAAWNLEGVEAENKLTTVDIFVFENDESGKLAAYKQYGINEIDGGKMTMKLKTGVEYKVYAFANADLYEPENITDESSLLEQELWLSSDNTNINEDYGLSAMSDAIVKTFTDDNTTLTITVNRIAARVRLVKVTNNLPAAAGAVTIKSVFLSNVAGEWCKSGREIRTWLNKYGRVITSSQIQIEETLMDYVELKVINIVPYLAECGYATFRSINASISTGESYDTSPVSLYCYANNSEIVPNGLDDNLEDMFNSPRHYDNLDDQGLENARRDEENKRAYWSVHFDGQHTMLVVETEIGGVTYYYPIDLNKRINANHIEPDGIVPNVGIERNKTYDVSLTINNYGSPDEPNREISTLSANYQVSVGNWDDGGTIDADF